MEFYNDFWQHLRQLARTLDQAMPLSGSEPMRALLAHFQNASPEQREQVLHQLEVVISRLIRISQSLEVCETQECQ